jgi:hypothetical protein
MRISTFRGAKDATPVHVDEPWENLAMRFQRFSVLPVSSSDSAAEIKAHKERVACWSPASFRGGRLAANVESVCCAVLDFDGTDRDQTLKLMQEVCEFAHVIHTTPRNDTSTGRLRWRAIIPLSRPATAAEWPAVWRALKRRFPLTDSADSDASRIYFMPACLADKRGDVIVHIETEGPCLNTDDLIAASPGKVEASEPVRPLTRDDLRTLAKRLVRSADLERAQTGRALNAIAAGEPWAEPGERDSTLFACLRVIVREAPWATDASVIAALEPSRALMARGNADSHTAEDVAEKLARIREHARQPAPQVTARLADSGVAPYSEAELQTLADFCQCDRQSLQRRWIVQRNGAQYFLVLDDSGPHYVGPFPPKDCRGAAAQWLARATSAGISLTAISDKGRARKKSADDLLDEYGQIASEVNTSLVEQRSRFDFDRKAMIEAPAPLRSIEPRYDAEVDRWLQLLCGPQYQRVLQWLSMATELDKPLPAIFFTGSRGNGKGLFAESVARLWTTKSATKYASLAGNFNELITSCPLVFADEYVPLEKGTEKLREFITDRHRPLNRKFLPTTVIEGCVRLVIAANEEDALRVGGDISADSLGALAERMLIVKVDGHAAREFVAALPDRGDSFRAGDRLAAYAMWLKANLKWERKGRMSVTTDSGDMIEARANQSGTRGDVLEVIFRACRTPAAGGVTPTVILRDGVIMVHVGRVIESWPATFGHDKCPRTRVREAIQKLGDGKERQPLAGSRARYLAINVEALRQYAQAQGYDREIVDDWFAEAGKTKTVNVMGASAVN